MTKYIKEFIYYFCHRILWLLLLIPSIHLKKVILLICGSKIGKNVSIHIGVKIIAPWNLKIGNNCTINSSCMIDARGGISISDNVMIGYQSSIHSIGHNYREDKFPVFKSAVKIDSDVVIFSHCFVGPGVHLKYGCTLLPTTTVFKGVYDERSTLIGNPCKVINKNGNVVRGKQFHNSPFGF